MYENITLGLPIYVRLHKRKNGTFSLNLNTYRNAHYHILNNAKALFEKNITPLVNQLPTIANMELTYSLFFGSKRQIDIANICCIVDKFFCDTLVNQKKLIDDNMDIISKVTYQWGGVDTLDPRVEVTISNIKTVEDIKPMQIILSQQEVEEAIRETVLSQIAIREDQAISITFTGIKEGSFAVNVLIQKADETTAPRKTRTRKPNTIEVSAEPTEPTEPEEQTPLEEPAKAEKVLFGIQSGNDDREPEVEKPAELGPSSPIPSQSIFPTATQEQVAASPKIFQNIHSSAPDQEVAVTTHKATSLFANLTKPVHDVPAE